MKEKISIPLAPLDIQRRYKLLASLVIPRPIAWISTMGKDGTSNLAPYSFFNIFGSNPPLVIISQGNRIDGTPKDTPSNIADTGEFAVNLLDETQAEAMNASAASFVRGESEIEQLGLKTASAHQLRVPLLADCPANLECKLIEIRQYGGNRIVFGEVVEIHLDPAIFDPDKFHILQGYQPIAKLGGNEYCTTANRFQMKRPE